MIANKISQFDLVFDGKTDLPIPVRPHFDKIGYEIRSEFVAITEKCSSEFIENIDWWVSLPCSRDVLNSRMFYYCCVLELVKKLMKESSKIREIKVTSTALFHILKDITAGTDINIKLKRTSFIRRICNLKPFCGSIFLVILPFYFSRKYKFDKKTFLGKTLTLIDTFVLPGFIEEDRYYPKMLDFVSEKEKKNIYFVPTFSGFTRKDYKNLFITIRNSTRQFLLKEDFLAFSDYIYSFMYIIRKRKIKLSNMFFRGTDIASLFKEELMSNERFPSIIPALLNYRFAMRLKKADIKIRYIIDWFENQIIDKGWNSGFKCWYPNVPSVGYQGMLVSDHWLHKYPTDIEIKAGVVPNMIFAPGPSTAENLKQFSKNITTREAPALRFASVFKEYTENPNNSYYTILVGLPNFISDAISILRLLDSCLSELNDLSNLRFHIKRHPAISIEIIKQNFGHDWPEKFIFVEGDFNKCIEEANLLVSSTSSVCLESLAKGTPVLVVGSTNGLTYNPIPNTVDSAYWKICFNISDIIEGIRYFWENPPATKMLSQKIVHEYFTPINRKSVREFLFLDS